MRRKLVPVVVDLVDVLQLLVGFEVNLEGVGVVLTPSCELRRVGYKIRVRATGQRPKDGNAKEA